MTVMGERAQVKSIESIENFRTALVLYLNRVRAVLEEVSDAKIRTSSWLQNDQRSYWEREYRVRSEKLNEAQQELFRAKLSQFRTESAAQILAVERAKSAVRHADEKRTILRKWTREFDNRADPMVKQVEQLQTFVVNDLAKAALHLDALVKSLEAYAQPQAPSSAENLSSTTVPGTNTEKGSRVEDSETGAPFEEK